jgi:hypothetical protein
VRYRVECNQRAILQGKIRSIYNEIISGTHRTFLLGGIKEWRKKIILTTNKNKIMQ